MKKIFLLCLLFFSTIAVSADSDDEPKITPKMSPAEKYHETATFYYQTCSL